MLDERAVEQFVGRWVDDRLGVAEVAAVNPTDTPKWLVGTRPLNRTAELPQRNSTSVSVLPQTAYPRAVPSTTRIKIAVPSACRSERPTEPRELLSARERGFNTTASA